MKGAFRGVTWGGKHRGDEGEGLRREVQGRGVCCDWCLIITKYTIILIIQAKNTNCNIDFAKCTFFAFFC